MILFALSGWAQRVPKNKEESLKQQSLDDIEALSSKDYPYIEKFHQAVREKMAGNFNEAIKLFDECLKERSNDDAVHYALGLIAKEQNMKSKALDYFKTAQKLDPQNIIYTQELAYMQYEKAEFGDAAENFRKMTEHEPRNVDWLYGYAQVLVYNRKYEEAITIFNRLQDQVGVIPEIMIMKADLYQEINKPDKAEQTLLELKNEFPENVEVLKTVIGFYEERGQSQKAIDLIKELSIAEPNNGVAHFILATEYAKTGKNTEFLNALRVVVESKEISVADKMNLIKHLYTFPGLESEKILEISRLLTEVHKDNAEILAFRADVLSESGKTREALNYYREALKNNTAEYRLWTTVLAFESAYKDYEALYEDAKEAVSLFPTLPFVYYAAAEGALYTNRTDEAMEYLEAGELYILDDKNQLSRFAMRKGEVYFQQKDWKKGNEQFNKALEIMPGSALIKVNYAQALINAQKNLSQAEDLLKSVEDQKRASNYFYALGSLYLVQKEYKKGIDLLKSHVNNLDYSAEIYDLLGDLYMLSGDKTSAIESWKKAADFESRNKSIEKKIKEETFYAPRYY